jgi:hypothetical protein
MAMKRLQRLVAVTLVAATSIVPSAGPASADPAVLVVSPSGNDANPGTFDAPLRNLSTAVGRIAPGGDVYLRGGTYDIGPATWPEITRGGTATNRTSILGYPGEEPILSVGDNANCMGIRADHVELWNVTCVGADINVWKSSDVVIVGNRVRDSRWDGINIGTDVPGHMRDIVVAGNTITRTQGTGIWVGRAAVNSVSNVTIVDNTVTWSNLRHRDNMTGGWGSGISVVGAKGAYIVGNRSSKNFGEGINCPMSDGCYVARNTVWDSKSVLLYADNTSNSMYVDNFLYNTGDRQFYRTFGAIQLAPAGIQLANEDDWFTGPANPSYGNFIANNVVVNTSSGVAMFTGYGNAAIGFKNTLVLHNTLTGITECGLLAEPSPANANNWIVNNIVDSTTATCSVGNGSTFMANLWSAAPGAAAGWRDVVGSPAFVGGALDSRDSYRLRAQSAAVDRAFTFPWFTTDASGGSRPRGAESDIGAFER